MLDEKRMPKLGLEQNNEPLLVFLPGNGSDGDEFEEIDRLSLRVSPFHSLWDYQLLPSSSGGEDPYSPAATIFL